ncbi:IclR family transcriptional regulator [Neorhizobium lilium]|uniref:IclR family transcriptional regulator n=1 Tax=Neorhizobium lilium TaxID=2503024 RepID=A0A444LMC6_9HYPH|nr:IclR family transcriptional regulator [Neorhizobium lilium]RWX81432.1 IclR family transcriptional regulator [Neorhizobium lilium]
MVGNQSLERGLAILNLLGTSDAELGIRDIARALSLSPTIVQRLVNTLHANGFVAQSSDTKRYRLGYRAIVLGSTMRREDRLLSAVTRELAELADKHHLNGYLGVLRDGSGMYLESIQSSGPISVRILPGSRINMHSTAIGKMLLSTLPDVEVHRVLGAEPLTRYTARTRQTIAEILDDLATSRREGYATVYGENIEGVASAATLIRDARGEPVASISVALLFRENEQREMATAVRLVRQAAYRCSQSIGYAGPAPELTTDSALQEAR